MDKLFDSCKECREEIIADVKGQIPLWLNGNLIRIGPGKWDFKDFCLNHWLDGCALLCQFNINNGRITFKSKYIESEAKKKMNAFNRPVFTEFGTKAFPDPSKNVLARIFSQIVPSDLTDNDNLNIYQIGNEFYAATETCNIWGFDLNSLDTKDKVNLDKTVGVNLASCHVHHCPSEGVTYNLASSFLSGMKYHIVKIQNKQNNVKNDNENIKESSTIEASILATIPSSWSTCVSYYHSYSITENYIIFLEQPLLMNGFKLATCTPKGKPLRECFEWHPNEKTKFFVINKSTGIIVRKYYTEAMFFLHHINAYEDDDHIVVDIVTYDEPAIIDKWFLSKMRNNEWDERCPPIPRRYVIPLFTEDHKKIEIGTNLVKLNYTKAEAILNDKGNIWMIPEQLGTPGFEIPTINYQMFNGKKYQFCYGSGVFERGNFANSICKLDLNTKKTIVWHESASQFPGECIYVPNPESNAEDDGIILSLVLESNLKKSHFLLILNAKTFKEIARAYIPRNNGHIPPTIHGIFVPHK